MQIGLRTNWNEGSRASRSLFFISSLYCQLPFTAVFSESFFLFLHVCFHHSLLHRNKYGHPQFPNLLLFSLETIKAKTGIPWPAFQSPCKEDPCVSRLDDYPIYGGGKAGWCSYGPIRFAESPRMVITCKS